MKPLFKAIESNLSIRTQREVSGFP